MSLIDLGDKRYGGSSKVQRKFERYLLTRPMEIPNGINGNPNAVRFGFRGPLWDGGWRLGRGANAVTGLWIQQNAQGRVVERMAIKDIAMQNWPGCNFWNGTNLWVGGNVGGRLKEAVSQRTLNLKQSDRSRSNLVKAYGHYPMSQVTATHPIPVEEDRRYRVFMELCNRGSLDDMVEKNITGGDPDQFREIPDEWRSIPEPFLWHLFEQLALACAELEGHPRPAGVTAGPNDAFAVHADMKLQNILLCDPDPTLFPEYPRAKLCDFGMTRITGPYEAVPNATIFRTYQPTDGWAPPELWKGPRMASPAANGAAGVPYPVTAKANIWGIARVILACMDLDRTPRQINYAAVPLGAAWIPQPSPGAVVAYSQTLQALVDSCLDYDPTGRPSSQALLLAIRGQRGPFIDGMDTWRCPPKPTAADKRKERGNRPCAKADTLYPIGSKIKNGVNKYAVPKTRVRIRKQDDSDYEQL